MKDKIIQMLSGAPGLPVLFIGSGISKRYLDLPDWESLLKKFCIKESYEYYYFKANKDCSDRRDMLYPKIADYIEADFNEMYLTDERYSESRKAHADEINKKVSPLKFCMADFFKENHYCPN